MIFRNPKNELEWVTMNGYLGQFTNKQKEFLRLVSMFRLGLHL